MQAGLLKILTNISGDPANQMLVDRYLKLVKELKIESKKAEYILKLAEVLEESDPQLSMQYAYMVFQFNHLSTDALQIVVRCLRNLGRFAKAEVLQNELRKLKDIKQKPDDLSEQDDSAGFSMEVSKINVDGVDLLVSKQSTVFGQQVLQSPTFKMDAFDINAQRATVKLPEKKASAAKAKRSPSAAEKQQPVKTKPPEVLPTPHATMVPNPTVPPQGSAEKQLSWTGPDLGVFLELFDFYYRQGLVEEAEDMLLGIKKDAADMPWWKARMAALTKKRAGLVAPSPEAVNAILAPVSPLSPPSARSAAIAVPQPPSREQQRAILPQALQDCLTKGRYRRGMHEVRDAFAQNPSLDLAELLFQAYQECCEGLGLMCFQWRRSDGLERIQEQIKQRPRSRLQNGTRRVKKTKAG